MAKLQGHKVNADKTTDLAFSGYPTPEEIRAACASLGFKWDGGTDSGREGYGDFPKTVRVKGVPIVSVSEPEAPAQSNTEAHKA